MIEAGIGNVTEGEPPVAITRRGPLVHRSVRHGAILLMVASVQFLIANIVTQIGYGPPSYSLSGNFISDLGAVHCGVFGGSGSYVGHYACSPWHDVFNASAVVMGLLLILAVPLILTAFPARRSRTIGLGLFALAGFGAIGVGLAPEDVNITVHSLSATIAFAFGALSLLVLGFAMLRDTRWDGFRAFTLLCGLVGLVALILFLEKAYLGLGVGGMERLIVAPILLWAFVVGLHLARIPTYAPPGLGTSRSS
ncbi:MAG: DUF998 domain-containing protein [Thermoplasmata archaeon]|nr:DUF998 domain-containing protein [Thermoplasmata archaeon]